MHKLKINPLATEDLIEIKTYISKDLENLNSAVNTVNKIIEKYTLLKEFPLMGTNLSSRINIETNFRYLISDNYLIFYRADDEFVYVYRILYSGRDYLKILFPNRMN
ncbi:MAG: type II toxin-antitoxin system RelE/ParE family toxin [Bacillota bacterium]|nr:type II toxin-antitoxin system RelE/ParE family toxin [Bacillota bacterium]